MDSTHNEHSNVMQTITHLHEVIINSKKFLTSEDYLLLDSSSIIYIIKNAEASIKTLSNVFTKKQIFDLGLAQFLAIDRVEEAQFIHTAYILNKCIFYATSLDNEETERYSSYYRNVCYYYRYTNKNYLENIEKLKTKRSYAFAKLMANKILSENYNFKYTDISHVYDYMTHAGYCKGDVVDFYHPDLADIGLTSEEMDKVVKQGLFQEVNENLKVFIKVPNAHLMEEEYEKMKTLRNLFAKFNCRFSIDNWAMHMLEEQPEQFSEPSIVSVVKLYKKYED